MKKQIIALLTLSLVAALAATGCKGKKNVPVTKFPAGTSGTASSGGRDTTTDTAGTVQTPPGPAASNVGGTDVNPMALPDPKGLDGMTPDREIFKANTVYFDFDMATIRASEHSKIDEVAKVLKARPNTKLQIEGHCDERGTEEYNRALGERRALAIRDYLMKNSGISGERIFTISFGEDKPAVPGHNEAAWAKNRRGEFILYSPKQ